MAELFTGIDLVKIDRIRKSMENPRFAARVFSASERDLFACKKDPYPSFAANFPAKEAFSKALGAGVRGFALNEVSVLRDELGAPYFVFTGNAARIVEERGLSFSVSLTHTEDTAGAFVIAWR